MLMIICRVTKSYFVSVVQKLFNPAGNVGRVISLLFLIILSGCNNWPDPAERVLAVSQRQSDIPEAVDPEYIENLVSISKARLEFLVSSGAQYCLPGQINKVRKYLLRAKHEVDGNLLLDAQYTLSKAMEQLDRSAELMMGLAQGSECLEAYSYSDTDTDKADGFVDGLSRMLNCQCDQISNESTITEGFSKRLEVAAKAMSAQEPLRLVIYTSKYSAQAHEMQMFFSNHGVRKKQIEIRYEGIHSSQLSPDGFWFDIAMGQTEKLYKLKEWKRDVRLMSIQKEKGNER